MKQNTQDHVNDVVKIATGDVTTTLDMKGKKQRKKVTALDPQIRADYICLDRAIDYFGTISELARALDVSAPNVHYWKTHTGLVPTDRAWRLHHLTDGFIDMKEVLEENEKIRLANKVTY